VTHQTKERVSEKHSKIWRSLRFLAASGTVTAQQIAIHARTTDEYARKILRRLELAGYLRVICEANPRAGRCAAYRLIRNTGPRTPIFSRVGRKQIFDPNTKTAYEVRSVARAQTGRERALAWIQGRQGLWTVVDLVGGTAIQLKNAQKYLTELSRDGVVAVVAQVQSGPEGGNALHLYQWTEEGL